MREEFKKDRQRKVLEMIIRYHITTAEPIGSYLISKEIGLSSATIRNIMFELEELGLIWQPHTSAGRMPTDKGYRAYVDSLMELKEFLEFGKGYPEDAISYLRSSSIEDVILKGLQFCSRVTSQTCIATLKIEKHLIERFEDKIKDILTSLYDFEGRLYLDGTHYLVEQPEFKDIEKISSVLKILEDKKGLLEILEEDVKNKGIKVHIGSENKALGFDQCTLITANYDLEDDISGSLGIIGPMRMEYQKVIPTVGRVAELISELFSEMV